MSYQKVTSVKDREPQLQQLEVKQNTYCLYAYPKTSIAVYLIHKINIFPIYLNIYQVCFPEKGVSQAKTRHNPTFTLLSEPLVEGYNTLPTLYGGQSHGSGSFCPEEVPFRLMPSYHTCLFHKQLLAIH